jgi:predicted XRE-type DNA-binding protein
VRSNITKSVEQGSLPLTRAADWIDLPTPMVMQQKTLLGAVNLCITQSGLEDKEIYLTLGIDAGHFSNIRKGVGHFPINKLNELCDLCGNEAPLIWWANSRGKGLVLLVTEAERRAAAAETRAKDAEEKLRFLTQIMQGKVAA